MENLLIALLVAVIIVFVVWYMRVDDELDRLREEQRLDDLEDEERERLLGDLQYRQDRYDRWRYWSGPRWGRWGWRHWGRPHRRYWKAKK